MRFGICTLRVAVGLLGIFALPADGRVAGIVPAIAKEGDLQASVREKAAQRYAEQQTLLQRLRSDPAPEAQYQLALLLDKGLMINPANPLPKKRDDEAETVLRNLIATTQGEARRKPEALLAQILLRSDGKTKREEGRRMSQTAGPIEAFIAELAQGDDGAEHVDLPPGADIAALRARLEKALEDGNPRAAFALSQLSADDPASADAYRERGVLQLAMKADDSIVAAIDLAERYLAGNGLPQDQARAVGLLRQAVRLGSNRALLRLDELARLSKPAVDMATMHAAIAEGLSFGLSQAAELIADDLLKQPRYGFSRSDSLYAVALLSEIEDRRSLPMAVTIYAKGLNGPADLEAARPFLAAMARVEGLPADTQMRTGREIMTLPIPDAMKRQYAFPIFAASAKGGDPEGVVQFAKLMLADPGAAASGDLPIPTDDVLALLRKAGENGHRPALVLLGDMNRAGVGIAPDGGKAAGYYRQALRLAADDDVKERLARAIRDVKVKQASLEEYWSLLEDLSGRNASLWASKEYGAALLKGDRGLVADPQRGVSLLRNAYQAGYLQAGDPLAKFFADSRDPKLIAEAISLFEKIWTETRSESAGVNLSELYLQAGRLNDVETITDDPGLARSHQARYLRAKVALQRPQPNPEEAFAFLDKAISIAGETAPRSLTYAKLMFSIELPAAKRRAVAVLDDFADKGEPKALSELIPYYLARVDAEPDVLPKLARWTRMQAQTGRTEDVVKFARPLIREGVPAVRQRFAFELLDEVHKLIPGDASVSLLLANAYRRGFGVAVDPDRAKMLIEQAAASGARDAQIELAEAYLYGIGYERNAAEATRLLERAAAQNSDRARMELGRLYSASEGSEFNPQKAFAYFSRAANGGSAAAMMQVGLCYIAGSGVTRNETLGLQWLQKAVDARMPDAMYQLYFYHLQRPGPEERAKAVAYLKQAADAGILTAKLRYAIHLRETDPVKNHDEILATLKAAMAAGHNSSRRYLLEHYRSEM